MSWVVRIEGLKRDGTEPGVSRRVVEDDEKRQALRSSRLDKIVGYSLFDPAFAKTKNAVAMLFGIPVLMRVYFIFFKRHRHLMVLSIGGTFMGLGYYYSYCKCHDLENFIRRDTVAANSIRDILREDMIDRKFWADYSPVTKQIIVNRAFAYEFKAKNEVEEEKPSKFLPKPSV